MLGTTIVVRMAAITTPKVHFSGGNRRRRLRHKIHTPAYASFTGASKGLVLELNEVLDISEDGIAVQCGSAVQLGHNHDLCLDLAEAKTHIYTTALAVWSDSLGRVGFRFPNLPDAFLLQLRDWLFFNALAAVVNSEPRVPQAQGKSPQIVSGGIASLRPDYTNTLAAVSAVQREVESLGADQDAVLQLVASRAQALVHASGAAIALSGSDSALMTCQSSAGVFAPPVGSEVEVGSGFSGQCASQNKTVFCYDTQTDSRVDCDTCRALGIRSLLATPIRSGGKVIGILEAFSSEPGAFQESDGSILQRLAETVALALNRAAEARPELSEKQGVEDQVSSLDPSFAPSLPPEGSVFSPPGSSKSFGDHDLDPAAYRSFGVRLPQTHLVLLILSAATIALAMGFILAPWIEERLQGSSQTKAHTVFASSAPPAQLVMPAAPNLFDAVTDTASLEQLRQLAAKGDPSAQNALGIRYATGEGVKQDEKEAAGWFTKSAEQGYVVAQSALGARYWAGRGVAQDINKAYYWTLLARAGGDTGSRTLATVLASHMTKAQAAAIEQEADLWFGQRQPYSKQEAVPPTR